ncbi:MAG: ABC transporter substrate-binding protein [Clostridia bacterium]|nr:ABC transporter substrate-binding protein [Clostridia bacterium]
MKKLIALTLALLMVAALPLAMTSCGDDGKYTVGIVQLVTHDALDSATNGFKQALIDELGAENVTFDYQNAGNDAAMCKTITDNFASKNVDLIMANATPALQAAVKSTNKIPVLGTSITEYGVALELKNFNGTVGGNVSGTSDLADLQQQAQMVTDLVPGATKVGLLYCASEANSVYQVNVVKAALEAKNITCKTYTFVDTNDVSNIAAQAASENDALYIPTDNTAASCASAIYAAMGSNKKPIVAGEEGICKGCGIATLSISYYDLGYTTGKMAAKILKGEADVSTMPIEYAPTTKKYNEQICKDLGIDIQALKDAGYVAISGTEAAN